MKSDKRLQGEPAVPNGDALFGSLFAQTAVGVAVISTEGVFARVNEALCRMLGYGEQELLQKNVRDVTHADDLESTRSEEHTSELQSRFDLVCRLLLEKKKE